MGNKISNVTAIAGIDSYVSELGDVYYERSIGNARFMKTIRGRHKGGLVVVKIFVKPELDMSLRSYVKKLQDEYDALLDVSNVFFFQRILETERAAYLVRQYFYSSLYDRISTRPFLTTIEKKWIVYQILRGVADAHAKQVYHGDIKTENVLVTSWNWAYLVDFASFKPTHLPEDNPADFSFFFDTSSRRSCYIAPERFYKAGSDIDQRMKNLDLGEHISELTPEMDIFSVGCVIAELFLEGTSIFSLSQIFKYRNGEYSPDGHLDKIEDEDIRDMIRHMIQIDPKSRFSAEQYLSRWRAKAFPQYFYTFLHQYISSVTDKFDNMLNPRQSNELNPLLSLSPVFPGAMLPNKKVTDADEKIERIYHDFDKIAFFLSLHGESEAAPDSNRDLQNPSKVPTGDRRRTLSDLPNTTASSILLPHTLNIPNYETSCTFTNKTNKSIRPGERGSLIFLSFVCSLIRNTVYPSSKLKALDILLALGEHLPDVVKLDRLVPYLMALLSDESDLVRANALKTLTQVLCMVESISPINARIFPEYILPSVREFANDPNVMIRTTYAGCIALLAETALRFLEMTQFLKNEKLDSEDLDFESSYDSSLHDLQSTIQEQVTILLIDSESSVKRALLTNITCLCVFFGRQKANDILLSHMITYLNDRDWMLRSAFFESIKGVGTFVGSRSLEEYILPLMIQALTDAEEFVVDKVLHSLTSLADLGLFQKMKQWELVGIIAPLLCHPSIWIRYGAVGFISSTAKHLPQTDIWCIVYPLLRPFLRSDIADITESELLENIKLPLPRQRNKRGISEVAGSKPNTGGPAMLIRQGSLFNSFIAGESLEKSQEDNGYLERLRNVGMSAEDEQILIQMREYIYKVSCAKLSRPKTTEESRLDARDKYGEIYLRDLGVTPLTVFLPDISQQAQDWHVKEDKKVDDAEKPRSIKPLLQSRPKEDICKLNRVASQPHVQALLPSLMSTASHDLDSNEGISSPVEIRTQKSLQPPIPSPTNGIYASSAPTTSHDRAQIAMHHTNGTKVSGSSSSRDPVDQDLAVHNDKMTSATTEYPPFISSKSQISPVGRDYLYKLVYKAAVEAFPPHMPGDPTIMKRIRRLPQGTSPFRSISNWRPEGTLVAHFTEHTAAINQLAISWDNLLFASCSDDGSVKIWDCSRLERNVTNRSRATYNSQGGRIKCLTFIQQTYSIAAASDNGSIHIFRIDIRSAGSALKFGKCITIREHQLADEYAVVIKHFTSNASNTMARSKSILLYATTKGNIYAMDILTMEVLWKLQNRKSHGRREVSVWDIVKLQCVQVFALKSGDEKTSGVTLEAYKAIEAPEDKEILMHSFTNDEANLAENAIRAIVSPSDCRFMITGGSDRKLRFWDTVRVENSGVILGLDPSEVRPRYSTNTFDDIKFYFESTHTNRNNTSTSTSAARTGFSNTSQAGGNSAVAQQQQLMRNHTDAIMDVVLTEVPYPMIISADRDGTIKVIS
ncbi:Serine/threonine-protein kinase [Apophysomyces ossiformis]|uniref:non-specific serine/threonine protein kinase n=1 Tax=Apophysomyces ossiformis TaxID=679940 RepID=A0A8H7BYF1_9FUNG|nr:Serine/threonine-protein kinase [Apophysomyces ossiformis]